MFLFLQRKLIIASSTFFAQFASWGRDTSLIVSLVRAYLERCVLRFFGSGRKLVFRGNRSRKATFCLFRRIFFPLLYFVSNSL